MAHKGPIVVPIQKLILDIFLVMCVGFPILFLFLWGNAYHRGFFCEDTSIRHPYHESTVPSIYLYFTGLVMNCIVMSLTEYLNRDSSATEVIIAGLRLPPWMWSIYNVILVFAFGAACSQLSTDIMKYTIGRLRPHFYTVCLPSINCDAPENRYKYHTEFNCTNERYIHNKRIMKELRLSFPSGHSSFSMYTMMYFAIYLQKRMTWDGSKLLKHTLQFLGLIFSIFTGMTRVSDYKHHWSDVLIGLLIGTISACSVARFASTLFENNKTDKSQVQIQRLEPTSNELNSLNGNRAQLVYGSTHSTQNTHGKHKVNPNDLVRGESNKHGVIRSLSHNYINPVYMGTSSATREANENLSANHSDPLLIDIEKTEEDSY